VLLVLLCFGSLVNIIINNNFFLSSLRTSTFKKSRAKQWFKTVVQNSGSKQWFKTVVQNITTKKGSKTLQQKREQNITTKKGSKTLQQKKGAKHYNKKREQNSLII
jgi:hypothetical protein